MDPNKFTLKSGQQVLAVPCLEVDAFAYGVADETGAGLERFLDTFVGAFGKGLRFYRTGDMKRYRAIDAKALDGPRHWFSDPGLLSSKMLAFVAHSGEQEDDVRPPAIRMSLLGNWEEPRFVLRMMLPAALGDSPEDVVALVGDALSQFPLATGHCGYSFVWEWTDPTVTEEVHEWAAPLLLRHPGLGYGDPISLSNAAQTGVVAVSWLTLLGAEALQLLGGLPALQAAAPAGVTVLPLGSTGAIVRAGDAPQAGDVNRRDPLPAYKTVGSLVEPARASDDALDEVAIDGMPDEEIDDWLRRFFP